MKFLLKFLCITFISYSASSSPLRCDYLFSNTDTSEIQLKRAAESLASYRHEMRIEENPLKKITLMQEFEIKFAEYLNHAVDAEHAKKLFQNVYENSMPSANRREDQRVNRAQLEEETQKLRPWNRILKVQPFQAGTLGRMRLTPDGSKIIVNDLERTQIKIYDAKTLQELPFPIQPPFKFENISISGDGSRLFFDMENGDHFLVDLHSLQQIPIPKNALLTKNRRMMSAALSFDGSRLAYISSQDVVLSEKVKLYDFKSQKHIALPEENFANAQRVFMSKDGSKVVIARKNTGPKIFDLNTNSEIKIPGIPEINHPEVTLSSNDVLALSWSRMTNPVFFDLNTQSKYEMHFSKKFLHPDFVPNTNWSLVRSKGVFYIIDPKQNMISEIVKDPSGALKVPQIAMTSDGSEMLVAFENSLRLYTNDLIEIPFAFSTMSGVGDFSMAPDDSRVVGSFNKTDLVVFFRH